MFELRFEQFVAEIHRRAVHRPRRTDRFVGAEQQALAFLAEVDVALVIDTGRQLLVARGDLGNGLGDQVMVLHRLHRQVQAGQMADFARPQAAGVDDVLGVDRALVGDHVPAAVGALVGFDHAGVGVVAAAELLRRLGVGIGHAGRIDVAVERVPQRGDVALRIDQRVQLGNFLERDEFLVQPHVARLRAFALEIVVPGLVGGQVKAAGGVMPDRLARQLLELVVELDRVALQPRDVRVR